jgi:hypothetical protein
MTSEQANDEYSYPWNKKGVIPVVKIIAVLGILTLLCVAFYAVVSLITGLIGAISEPGFMAEPETLFRTLFFSLLLPLGVFGLCVFGLRKIRGYAYAPGDFKPKTAPVAPNLLGRQFEVRFAKTLISRSFFGTGTVKFDEEQMVLDGTLQPSIGLQLGIIVVVTVVPLVLFGFGLGIIPALILAALIGKKETSRRVSYRDILDLSIKGRVVSISCSGEVPNKFKFRVASSDGERLYRELYHHHPKAVAEWHDKLQQISSSTD